MRKVTSVDQRLKNRNDSELFVAAPVVIRVNKFDEESATKFTDDMAKAHNTGQSIIPIVIDSYGGQVYSLMSMVTEIQNSRIPVATIVEGKAMSCGAMLFGMGNIGHRYVGQNATVMIHDVSSGMWGKIEEIKADVKEAERLQNTIFRMLAKHCGHKDEDYFMKLIHNRGHADWFLTPKKVVKHKVADYIGVPEFRVNVNVDMSLKFE
jgi:ATP-dependent Clp protease, protease subunit